jgi:hypothetical protein
MKKNIIIIGLISDPANYTKKNSIRTFVLKELNCTVENEENVKVYSLNDAKPEENDILRAYWCPYKNNNCLGDMVGNDSRYMFTATMNGCSFGIGSAAPDGSRLVYHVNLGGGGANVRDKRAVEGSLRAQAEAQEWALLERNVPTSNIIEPMLYGGGVRSVDHPSFGQVFSIANTSTTVGLRSATGWDFYTLMYRKNGTAYIHTGFDRFKHLI